MEAMCIRDSLLYLQNHQEGERYPEVPVDAAKIVDSAHQELSDGKQGEHE